MDILVEVSLLIFAGMLFAAAVYLFYCVGLVRPGFHWWFLIQGVVTMTLSASYALEGLALASMNILGPWIRRPSVFMTMLMLVILVRSILPCILVVRLGGDGDRYPKSD